MGSDALTANAFAGGESWEHLRSRVTFSGVMLVLLGIAALIYDVTATIASVVVLGSLLLFAGVIQLVHAFQVRSWSGFFLYLLDGILRAGGVGALLVLYPRSGAAAITLVLSFYFIVGGVFRAIASGVLRFPGWGWTVGSGLLTLGLGTLLVAQWPASGSWFIGFAVGIDLILYGWALLMFAAAVKQLSAA